MFILKGEVLLELVLSSVRFMFIYCNVIILVLLLSVLYLG